MRRQHLAHETQKRPAPKKRVINLKASKTELSYDPALNNFGQDERVCISDSFRAEKPATGAVWQAHGHSPNLQQPYLHYEFLVY
jgi:hypothetical protein